MRLSLSSSIEHLELEDLIPDRYFVVLSFQLFDLSLKSNFLSFLHSLPHDRHEEASFCVLWLPSLPMLKRDVKIK